jgi:hypothetical protein
VAVLHIELCITASVLQLRDHRISRVIPFEHVDIVCRVVASTVDRVTQIDSRRVSRSDLRDRLGDAGPCEERAGKSTPENPHLHCSQHFTKRRVSCETRTAGVPEARDGRRVQQSIKRGPRAVENE